MASITVSDLNPAKPTVEITDLVDSRNLVNLHESETRSINGGSCTYASIEYGAGSTIRQADGYLYRCRDIRFRPDKWEWIGA